MLSSGVETRSLLQHNLSTKTNSIAADRMTCICTPEKTIQQRLKQHKGLHEISWRANCSLVNGLWRTALTQPKWLLLSPQTRIDGMSYMPGLHDQNA